MKSKIEFDSFYDSQLKSEVENLERKRLVIVNKHSFRTYRKWLIRLAVGTPVIIISSNFIPGLRPQQFFFLIFFSVVYAVVAPIYIFIRRNWVFDAVVKEYKKTVIPKLVRFVDEELIYEPEKGIAQSAFIKSDLFEKPTSYVTEDLVSGQAGRFQVQFADVNASRKSSKKISRNSSMKASESTDVTNVFYGLYGIIQFNRVVPGSVWIEPLYIQTGIAAADSIAGALQRLVSAASSVIGSNGQKVSTGLADFDRSFCVRGVNENLVRRIVTPAFAALMMAFKDEVKMPLYLALKENEMHAGFSGMNLFEISAHTSLLDSNVTFRYFNCLNLTIGLAEYIDQSSQ